jgi:hypothetical protein
MPSAARASSNLDNVLQSRNQRCQSCILAVASEQRPDLPKPVQHALRTAAILRVSLPWATNEDFPLDLRGQAARLVEFPFPRAPIHLAYGIFCLALPSRHNLAERHKGCHRT